MFVEGVDADMYIWRLAEAGIESCRKATMRWE